MAMRNLTTSLNNIPSQIFDYYHGLLGNPDNQLDPLHQFAQLQTVESIRFSAFDHPNVVTGNSSLVPGATSRDFIAEKRLEYGETGPLYLSRVRGLSPKEAHNALIKFAWLERAAERWENTIERVRLSVGAKALGVDPAQSENGDRMVVARWCGSVLDSVERVASTNALTFGQAVWQLMQNERIEAKHVAVDSVGVGSNVVNYLSQVLPPGKFVVRIEGGAEDAVDWTMRAEPGAAREYRSDNNRFLNMRAQVYWQLAQDLAHDLVAIPRHDGLWRELTTPTYKTEGGVVVLEKKSAIAKRLGRSPDYADAVAYGNWVRPRKATALPAHHPEDAPHHDPAVVYSGNMPVLRTRDGRPARWIGPEGDGDDGTGWTDCATSQFPVGF